MLIVGRILLGCVVGFANQAVPVFLSEIAPTRICGGLNILFQLNVTLGILFANLVKYGISKIMGCGWRLSLGLAGVPAGLLTVGALLFVGRTRPFRRRQSCAQANPRCRKRGVRVHGARRGEPNRQASETSFQKPHEKKHASLIKRM